MARLHLALACLVVAAVPPLSAQSMPDPSPTLEHAKAALNRYKDPILAVHDGYLSTQACMQFPHAGGKDEMAYPAGGMGVHFLNLSLVGQPLDTLRPQVLIYEPVGDSLRLAAAEWFVPVQVSAEQPHLFGRGFDGPMEGHEPIMPPELHHWDLHVWLWKKNPAGMFVSVNPDLNCPDKPYTVRHDAPHMAH